MLQDHRSKPLCFANDLIFLHRRMHTIWPRVPDPYQGVAMSGCLGLNGHGGPWIAGRDDPDDLPCLHLLSDRCDLAGGVARPSLLPRLISTRSADRVIFA
jgi:hypothetical protein